MIKVGVLGARGRMGSQVCQTVAGADDMEVAAGVDEGDLRDPLTGCDVVVDFTHPGAVLDNLRWCIGKGLDTIVGTSGFDEPRLAQVREWLAAAPSVRALIVPNFSVGAVLMMRFAEQAAQYFPRAEIVELHNEAKKDAPSGTARATAELLPGDTPIHSVRLPGLVAHQEVLLGGEGQLLTIRHDAFSREAYVPGVLLALERLPTLPPGLTIGLETLLD
jgi:4-hydroxy-tetrahydrodipicolinate reductase